jgi:geranylgeranyl pyrophosphate synthase
MAAKAQVVAFTPFAADRERAETELIALLGEDSSPAGRVQEAMRYAVLGGGQRLRPLLALRIGRLTGGEGELCLRAAAAVELVHCASLIVDDLPCMDDESLRRGRPTVHAVYGEPTALLAAFGLVALAARSVVEVRCQPTEMSALIEFQIQLLKVLDTGSLIEGQDLDLRLKGAEREALRSRVAELKTVPLFELAAKAGLLFVDSDSTMARGMRRFAREFGLTYQVADDYLDGEIRDFSEVESQLIRARGCLEPFQPAAAELAELLEYLNERCFETSRSAGHRRR